MDHAVVFCCKAFLDRPRKLQILSLGKKRGLRLAHRASLLSTHPEAGALPWALGSAGSEAW